MIHSFSQTPDDINKIVPSQGRDRRSDVERAHPLIQLHNQDSKDLGFVGSIADELINISGALVTVYIRTDSESYDKVYEEDPDPTYKDGKLLKAYFVPQPIASQLTPFGVDTPNQTTVVFSRERVFREFGDRMIRIGDLIAVPYNAMSVKMDRYRVLNAFDSGNFRYNWLYWSCLVENITDDDTIDIDHK